jgi:hypothetical protein
LRLAIFLLIVIAVLLGGGLLSYSFTQGEAQIPGMRVQTTNPEGNALVVTPNKGAWFFIFAGAILTSVVGFGATIAALFWFLNRQITRAEKAPKQEFDFTLNTDRPNSIGTVITRTPSATIAIIIVTLIVLAAVAAVVFGVFTPR